MNYPKDSHHVSTKHDFRIEGWWVELNGVRIAELIDRRPLDDDWDLYELRSVSDCVDDSVLRDDIFWDREGIIFRLKSRPEVTVDDAICRWSRNLEKIVVRYLEVHP